MTRARENADGFNTDAAQVFNESGTDVDFRIESDDNANMFFVNAGDDRIGIGTATPGFPLHVYSSENNLLHLESTDQDALFRIEDNGTGHFQINNAADNTSLGTNGRAEMMRFNSSSEIVLNEDQADQDFRVESDTHSHCFHVEGSTSHIAIGHRNAAAAADVMVHISQDSQNHWTVQAT